MYYTPHMYYSPFSAFLPLLALVVIIAGGLALYFLFVAKRHEKPLTPGVQKLHDALTFRTLFTEKLLRALYCIVVCALAIWSVILLFSNFLAAVLLFVIGNVIARICFELTLVLLILCRNTQEMNQKMGPLPEPPQPPVQQPPQPPVQQPPQNNQ